jgi:hypothetical protein
VPVGAQPAADGHGQGHRSWHGAGGFLRASLWGFGAHGAPTIEEHHEEGADVESGRRTSADSGGRRASLDDGGAGLAKPASPPGLLAEMLPSLTDSIDVLHAECPLVGKTRLLGGDRERRGGGGGVGGGGGTGRQGSAPLTSVPPGATAAGSSLAPLPARQGPPLPQPPQPLQPPQPPQPTDARNFAAVAADDAYSLALEARSARSRASSTRTCSAITSVAVRT